MRNFRRSLSGVALAGLVCSVFGLSTTASAQKTKARAAFDNAPAAEQPLYTEYKGVRLGMTDNEVRAKLGTPAMSDNEMDYFMFSDTETAQVNYDTTRKVRAISIDYAGGVGAPDHKTVVGVDLEVKDGSLYRMVRYQTQGFWVSYNRTTGPVIIVTITLQKI
jgi:outer membrane protein assembly factor BamE (lipoprotein component of BamABCDE complex)